MLVYYERRPDGTHELFDELKKSRKKRVKRINAELDKAIESGDAEKIKKAKERFLKEVGASELEYLD